MKAQDIIKKFHLDETTWSFKGFHAILFTFQYVGDCSLKWCGDYYGDQCKKSMFFVKEDYVRWYWPDDDMRRLRKLLIENVNKDPNYLKQMREDWENKLRKFDKFSEIVNKIKLSTLSESEFFALFDEFRQKYMEHFGIVMTVQDAYSMYSAEFLEPAFIKILSKDKFTHYYTTLMSPVEDSFITLEKKSRLHILKEFQKNGWNKKALLLLQDHQKKYFWVRNNYAKQPVLDIEFFKAEIEKMHNVDPDKELKNMQDEMNDLIETKKKMIEELNLSWKLINLIRITENFSYIQDERKKYVLIANHYQRLYIRELARRKKLTEKQLEYTVYPESKGKLDPKILDLRRKGCVCIQDNSGYYIYEGSEVEKIHTQLFGEQKKDATSFKGLTASKGIAKGSVKIVQKTHDLVNFNQGDILVSSMTRPEMVVAMKKASAIITDEGGITSHAAIVSRELGIPCLIGTKIATKVLKDGDLIEVDANKGLVKKL